VSSPSSFANARSRSFAGFTLLELLVAIAILALLSVLGYRALAALTDSEVRLTEEATRWRTLDQLFTRLESDMRQAQPRVVRASEASEPAWLGTTDADGNATCVFPAPARSSRSKPAAPVNVLVTGFGRARSRSSTRLISIWLRRHRRHTMCWPMACGRFRVWYLDPTGDWRDRWPLRNDPPMPRAVRVELELAGGETIERWLTLR
jgi:general secretion pathway protein J